MSSDVKEILKAFGEMTSAYEDAPRQRQRIDELEALLAKKDRDFDELEGAHNNLAREKANLEHKLQQTEEERDRYSFRANEAQGKLDRIYGVVAPAVEDVVTGQSATDPTLSSNVENGGVVETPISDVPPQNTVEGTDATVDGSGAESEVPPSPAASTSIGSTEPTGVTSISVEVKEDGKPDWETAEPSKSPSVDVDYSVDKPYHNQPSWSKPIHMTWEEWGEKGGVIPYWVDRKSA